MSGEETPARSVLRLALPIAVTQVGMVLYGTVDMLFVGRIGPLAIAAVGLGSVTYFTGFVVGMGIAMGIDSHSSRAFGAGRPDVCGQLLVHTLALALAVAAPIFLLLSLSGPAYRLIGVDPEVAAAAAGYVRIVRWSVFPGLCFVACRQYLQSMSVTAPMVWAIAAGNATNALMNWALIFGHLGSRPLGVAGAALATVCANLAMLSVAGAAARAELRRIGFRFHGWRRSLFMDVFGVGLPGGLQMLVEVAVFSLATALVGRLGAQVLAAHQLTLNLASATFMVPMALSHAASARVGQALGRRRPGEAEAAGRAAALMAVGFMAVTGALFASAPRLLLGLFGAGPEVVRLGAPLLYCSAAFQVFDGAQGALTGALRGLGETRRPFLYNLVGHWLVGLPTGFHLAFSRGMGAVGVWLGLTAGLVVVAALMWLEWERHARALLAGGEAYGAGEPRTSS